MAFCNNHETIYFDGLCRTKKAETLLSLIHATYQTKINSSGETQDTIKSTIAQKLVDAYKLFKFDAGTYNGDVGAFSSQYTIGHEMGIWKNSDLDLSDLAIKVALGDITIKEYLDVVFLNYIQPVKGKMIHILYHLLIYMKKNGLSNVTKEQMSAAYDEIVNESSRGESINAIFNFLIGTDFFIKVDRSNLKLSSEYKIDDIINNCNITYLDEEKFNYNDIKSKFDDLSAYLEYLLDTSGFDALKKSSFLNANLHGIDDVVISNISFYSEIGEEDFRIWLSKQIKKDGTTLAEGMQNQYYFLLKSIPSMLGFESVFSIKSTSAFEQYKDKLENDDDYKLASSNIGAGALRSALSNYKKYLEERTGLVISAERLVQILKNWCDNLYVEKNITSTLTGFGFKYAESIEKCELTPEKLLKKAGVEKSANHPYISHGKDLYFAIKKGEIGISFVVPESCSYNVMDFNELTGEAKNVIFYGVPGCGKSYHIQHNILDKENYAPENVIRTTFYQDYSNTDFVGQILPKIVKGENGADDTVEYIFNPGPFTLALIQAIKNPTENVALVVEEINRGNAPAIFGDIFQLLDRKNGISEYGVKNVQVMDYLNNYDFGKNGEEKRYHFDEIKIPGNLYIYATMNTSDQNVYTLDTAFTRRWNKEKISNNFINDKDKDYFKKRFVPGTDVLWKDFANAINEYISSKLDDLQVNEDKLIGAYFVKDNSLSVETESGRTAGDKLILNFAYKVLEYLWSDVSKLDHNIIFKSVSKDNKKINTLDALIGEFKKNGLSIFQDSIIKNMYKKESMIEDNNNPGIIDESADVNE